MRTAEKAGRIFFTLIGILGVMLLFLPHIGISVDSVFTLAKYKLDQQINFPLISDFNKEVSSQFGCLYDSFTDMGMKGVSKRSAFIIDKEGVIQYAEVLESAGDLPDFEAINKKLASLN